MLPLGATSESLPSSGFSATTMTRRGAPFHGATGEGKTVRSAVSPQVADNAAVGDSSAETGDPINPATSKNVVAATANQRARSMRKYPFLNRFDRHGPPPMWPVTSRLEAGF